MTVPFQRAVAERSHSVTRDMYSQKNINRVTSIVLKNNCIKYAMTSLFYTTAYCVYDKCNHSFFITDDLLPRDILAINKTIYTVKTSNFVHDF